MSGIGAGIALLGGFMSSKAAKKNARAQEEAARYNAAATLANGRIQGELTRFDAIGPKFQALMDADSSKTNAKLMSLNSDLVAIQGKVAADQTLLQAKYIMADAAETSESFELQAMEASNERNKAHNQFQQDIDDIEFDSRKKKALAKVAYASMGVAMNSGNVEAIDLEIVSETEEAIGSVMLAKSIESRSAGKVYREARKNSEKATEEGRRVSSSADNSAQIVRLEAETEALRLDNEAKNFIASGEYMNWYADFVEESSDLRASLLESGAQIQADSAFSVAMANAANTRRQGTVALVSGIGQGISGLASAGAFSGGGVGSPTGLGAPPPSGTPTTVVRAPTRAQTNQF